MCRVTGSTRCGEQFFRWPGMEEQWDCRQTDQGGVARVLRRSFEHRGRPHTGAGRQLLQAPEHVCAAANRTAVEEPHGFKVLGALLHAFLEGAARVRPEGGVVSAKTPRVKALPKVTSVEAATAEQRVCQAKCHGGVVRPLPRLESKLICHPPRVLASADGVPICSTLDGCVARPRTATIGTCIGRARHPACPTFQSKCWAILSQTLPCRWLRCIVAEVHDILEFEDCPN
mmetsp:Transcript_117889/g.328389  ORF Transcript_117889/g.328389 Transcript_117889/m.328389 type:complete len:230 (-) Transcript_117889:246-935(-)